GTFIKFATDEQRAKLPPEVINKWNHVSQEMARSHALAFKKGVPLTLGTDAPVAKDHCHTDFEMQLMVDELGLTPYEVIQAGTLISARCMRLDNELGSIKAGNLADLIVLAKDPETDITIFQEDANLEMVFKEGSVVSRSGKLET
ncbi:MAG: amidohydrolase family protein, partial [Candidatus Kariarchaeaceae archaeon]